MSESMTNLAARMVPPRGGGPILLATIAALAAIAVAIVWRFSPWTHQYFYGDDLDYLLSVRAGICATKASEILTATCQERFRPVASAFVIATMEWFGTQMKYFNAVNFLIQFIGAGVAFACAMRLSRGWVLVSAVLALAIGTSRFALFHATQAIGPVESLTFAAALCCIYCVLRFDADSSKRHAWAVGALLSAFIAIYTHERFVVLAAWLLIAFLSSPAARNLPKGRIVALALACVALPASYIGYKTLALDTTFMVGTNGTHIGFDFGRIFGFAKDATLSIFGFNRGPDYLAGLQPAIGLTLPTLAGAAFVGAWLALMGFGVTHALRGRRAAGLIAGIDALRWPLLLAILAFFVLFPALLTIRLEHRWLYAPFAFVVLIAAWAAGQAGERRRGVALGLCCVLGAGSLAVDSLVMRHFDRVFLVNSAHFAELAKRDIIDAYPDSRGPIRMIADPTHCGWTLRNGLFFQVYGRTMRPTTCYASLEDATREAMAPAEELYTYGSDDSLVNLTASRPSTMASNSAAQIVAFDFLASFATGKLSDTRHVDTPTGQGSLVLPWESTLGRRDAMIILSGFSHRFDDVEVPVGASLNFGVGMVYAAPQSARLLITATLAGSTRTLLSLDLDPPAAGKNPDFQPKSIDLAGFAGQKVTFEFSVQSPGGDATAHWVGLVTPVIAQPAVPATRLP